MQTIKRRAATGSRQSPQQIDEVMHRASGLYDRYRTGILSTLGAVLAVAFAAGGYLLYESGRDRAASELLSRAMEQYASAVSGQADYQKALELFRAAGTDYAGTMSGSIARYYAGNSLMGMGQFAAAAKEYQEFIKRPSGDRKLLGLVHQRLGYALAGSGEREQAIQAFEQAEAMLGTGIASSELAVLYERSGRKDEARKKYQALADALPGTALGEEARMRLGASAQEAGGTVGQR